MTFLCVDFKFKQQCRYAWLYCITVTIIVFCLTSFSFYNYSLFGNPSSLPFFGFSILQNIVLIASLTSFTTLMHHLRKRYNVLNSFLRYVSRFIYTWYYRNILDIQWLHFKIHFILEIVFWMIPSQIWLLNSIKKIQLIPSNLLDEITVVWWTLQINWIIVTHFR